MVSGQRGDRIADTMAVIKQNGGSTADVGAGRSLAHAHRGPPQAGASLTVDVAG
jgi:hypothetical protein